MLHAKLRVNNTTQILSPACGINIIDIIFDAFRKQSNYTFINYF